MAVKVSANEIVNLALRSGMHILEFVHRLEFDYIEPVWKDAVRFSLEKMLGFVRGDMRHGCENVRAVRRGPFNAVAMVDTTLSSFVVNVKVLEVVVEIDATGA